MKAEKMYDEIRMSNIDVSSISKNINVPEFQVNRVKDHIFFKEHKLIYGKGRFDPNLKIAESWKNLERGTFNNSDLKMFKHELFESKFEGIFKTNYETAHNAANRAGKTSGLNLKEEAIYGNLYRNRKNIRN